MIVLVTAATLTIRKLLVTETTKEEEIWSLAIAAMA